MTRTAVEMARARRARTAGLLTSAELAEASGLDYPTIDRWISRRALVPAQGRAHGGTGTVRYFSPLDVRVARVIVDLTGRGLHWAIVAAVARAARAGAQEARVRGWVVLIDYPEDLLLARLRLALGRDETVLLLATR